MFLCFNFHTDTHTLKHAHKHTLELHWKQFAAVLNLLNLIAVDTFKEMLTQYRIIMTPCDSQCVYGHVNVGQSHQQWVKYTTYGSNPPNNGQIPRPTPQYMSNKQLWIIPPTMGQTNEISIKHDQTSVKIHQNQGENCQTPRTVCCKRRVLKKSEILNVRTVMRILLLTSSFWGCLAPLLSAVVCPERKTKSNS